MTKEEEKIYNEAMNVLNELVDCPLAIHLISQIDTVIALSSAIVLMDKRIKKLEEKLNDKRPEEKQD